MREHCPTCHSKLVNYTRFGGGKRDNCCDHNVHFDACEHGDCWCECHKIKNQIQEYKDCKQYWYDKYMALVKQLQNINLLDFVALVDIAEGALESMEFDHKGICGHYEKEAFKLEQLTKELNNVK